MEAFFFSLGHSTPCLSSCQGGKPKVASKPKVRVGNPGINRSTTLKKKSEALRKNHTVIECLLELKLCWEKYIVVNMLHFLCFGKFKFSLEWVMFGRLLSWSWRVPCRQCRSMALIFWVDCTGKMLPVLNRTTNRVIILSFWTSSSPSSLTFAEYCDVIRIGCSDYTRL